MLKILKILMILIIIIMSFYAGTRYVFSFSRAQILYLSAVSYFAGCVEARVDFTGPMDGANYYYCLNKTVDRYKEDK